jgi:hypothetical protein
MVRPGRPAGCGGWRRRGAGALTAAGCCTGGTRIGFPAGAPPTSTAASRSLPSAGLATPATTSGGRRGAVLPTARVPEITKSQRDVCRGPRQAVFRQVRWTPLSQPKVVIGQRSDHANADAEHGQDHRSHRPVPRPSDAPWWRSVAVHGCRAGHGGVMAAVVPGTCRGRPGQPSARPSSPPPGQLRVAVWRPSLTAAPRLDMGLSCTGGSRSCGFRCRRRGGERSWGAGATAATAGTLAPHSDRR